MTEVIRMAAIEKRFPGVHALRSAQFDLNAGEVHALMGENGAGKSTLMKILSGIYAPDSGSVIVNGSAVRISSPRAAQSLGIGIIHQELALMPDLTVAQNIFIGREPRNRWGVLNEAQLNRDAEAIFAAMKVPLEPRSVVRSLTIAKQQMVEIAKALSFRSRILIMDEPTAALNEAETEELFAIIRRLKSEGVAIVYISHKMDEIRRISDRVTVMRDGAYVGTVTAADTPIETIISMMVGRELDQTSVEIPDLSSAPIALDVRGLTRGRMVRDVSFTVRRGEILGFAGLMGAGRTEVARVIFGADPRETGEIVVHGKPRTIRKPSDAVAAGIGYLSEDRKHFGLALGIDVRGNIALTSLDRFSDRFLRVNDSALAKVASE